jgi:hypothetical protein
VEIKTSREKYLKQKSAENVAQMIDHLSNKHETLNSNLNITQKKLKEKKLI